jgi:hypothetical protein
MGKIDVLFTVEGNPERTLSLKGNRLIEADLGSGNTDDSQSKPPPKIFPFKPSIRDQVSIRRSEQPFLFGFAFQTSNASSSSPVEMRIRHAERVR